MEIETLNNILKGKEVLKISTELNHQSLLITKIEFTDDSFIEIKPINNFGLLETDTSIYYK